jgi:hypothetical protein
MDVIVGVVSVDISLMVVCQVCYYGFRGVYREDELPWIGWRDERRCVPE